MYHFQNNPFSWGSASQVTSQVTSLQLTQADQSEVGITNLPDDINIILANNNASSLPPLVPSVDPSTNQTLYAFNWTNINSSVLIQVEPKAGDNENNDAREQFLSELTVCIQFDFPPNVTHNAGCTVLPQEKIETNQSFANVSNVDPYSWLLQPEDLVDVGQYYITVQKEQNLEDSPDHDVYAYSTQCVYWDGKEEEWKGDGCKVGFVQL